MWQLTSEEKTKRFYTNNETGSRCEQDLVYTDKEGNKWWQFYDLTSIPQTRTFASTKISSLYALGLSKDDLSGFINGMKTMLQSQDKEKYEKSYALLLDFENKANNATDAIKQMSSLVCVYFTINDELIDSFENNLQLRKMSLLEADADMHTFFLTRQIDSTERYTQLSNLISQIVSPNGVELQEASD